MINLKFRLLVLVLRVARKIAVSLGGDNSGAWCSDAEGGSGYGKVRCQCLLNNYNRLRDELDSLKADIASNRVLRPKQDMVDRWELGQRCPVCGVEWTGGGRCVDCMNANDDPEWWC